MLRMGLLALLACCCLATALPLVSAEAAPAASSASASSSAVRLSSDSALTHFTFGSCNKQDEAQPMWEHILARKPQLFIWLGDVIYADASRLEFFRHPRPLPEMAAIYAQQYSQANYTLLRESPDTRIVGVYDDHDYGENDGDASFVDKEGARQLFLDFVDEPKDSVRRLREGGGAYVSYKWGDVSRIDGAVSPSASGGSATRSGHTLLILLDSRYFQDAAGDDMLGATQWAWLETQLNTPDPVDLFILGSGVQLVSTDKRIGEGWRQTPRSRARVFDLLARRKHNQGAMVMFISGDVHLAETDVTYTCAPEGVAADEAAGSSSTPLTRVTPFYEFTSSGLTHSVAGQTGTFLANLALSFILSPKDSWAEAIHGAAHSIKGWWVGLNFADVQVDWEKQQLRVTYVDKHNQPALQHTLPFSALRAQTAPTAQLPQLVRDKCAEEALRAVSPPMRTLAGVKAGLLIVAALGSPVLLLAALGVMWNRRRHAAAAASSASKEKQR